MFKISEISQWIHETLSLHEANLLSFGRKKVLGGRKSLPFSLSESHLDLAVLQCWEMTHPFADYAGERKHSSIQERSDTFFGLRMGEPGSTSATAIYKETNCGISHSIFFSISLCISVVVCSIVWRTFGPGCKISLSDMSPMYYYVH